MNSSSDAGVPDGAELHSALVAAYEGFVAADNAANFHAHLATLISNAKLLPDQWLDDISTLAAKPWTRGRRGRSKLQARQDEIEWLYFHRRLGGLKWARKSREADIAHIVRSYAEQGTTITKDAAEKMYDKAAKQYAQRPYSVRGPGLIRP
jgi:hypothetical protein